MFFCTIQDDSESESNSIPGLFIGFGMFQQRKSS